MDRDFNPCSKCDCNPCDNVSRYQITDQLEEKLLKRCAHHVSWEPSEFHFRYSPKHPDIPEDMRNRSHSPFLQLCSWGNKVAMKLRATLYLIFLPKNTIIRAVNILDQAHRKIYKAVCVPRFRCSMQLRIATLDMSISSNIVGVPSMI